MLEELSTFLSVARASSFSAAAAQSGEAVSTVTRRIDRLEEDLEVELFARSTHALVLTSDGQRLIEHAQELLERAALLRSSMSGPLLSAPRPLRVSCFQTFGERILLPAVAQFLLQNTQIKIDVDLENRPVDLIKEGVDLAIRIGRPQDAALKMRRLLRHDMVLVASPSYLRRSPGLSHPRDLAHHNCLTLKRAQKRTLWHFRRGRSQLAVQATGNFRAPGGGPLIDFALRGLGVTLITRFAVARELREGTLEELLPGYVPTLRKSGGEEVFALYPAESTHPARAAFLEELALRCEREGL